MYTPHTTTVQISLSNSNTLNRFNQANWMYIEKEVKMFEEFCPECGHLLAKNKTLCQFCGWSEKLSPFIDKLFDSDTENDLDFKFTFSDNFQDNHRTAL